MMNKALTYSGFALATLLAASAAYPATSSPNSATVSPAQPGITFQGGPDYVSNPTPDPLGETGGPVCQSASGVSTCDDYTLNVSLPSDYEVTNPHAELVFRMGWQQTVRDDYDLYVYNSAGNIQGSAATSNDPEILKLPACQGSYSLDMSVVPYQAGGDPYQVSVTLVPDANSQVSCSGGAQAATASGPGVPRFQNYPAPEKFDGFENEPSVGVDWATGNIMFSNIGIRPVGPVGLAQPGTLRLSLNNATSPAQATWKNVSYVTTNQFGLDPILFTDSRTNRTFVSELSGACSFMAFTDNDGSSWTPGQGCGVPAGADHETVGGGPYAGGVLPVNVQTQGLYPDAVYYCSQDIFTAFCARSDDGGLTFGPGVPIYFGSAGLLAVSAYNLVQCQGLHGHVKVGPNGTVYVPNADCDGHPSVAVSEDNGLTWNVRELVADSSPSFSGSDPSVGVASDGTMYFCYQGADAHLHIAVTHDQGTTWSSDKDVSGPVGIVNTVFPAAVAGDPDRAACAFLGSTVGGDYQAPGFKGLWHLYVAYTYDGGNSWEVVEASPSDNPVQGPGGICTGGTSCSGSNRNLLDFIDAHLDSHGNVVVGYADGCTGACVTGGINDFDSLPTVAYQSGGNPLFSSYDPDEPLAPKPPLLVSAVQDASGPVALDWKAPDDGGSTITGYDIYRGSSSGTETLLAQLGASKTTYSDDSALAPSTGATYFYEVAAVNAVGTGKRGNELEAVAPALPPSPCRLPGLNIVTDPSGDQTGAPANTAFDIRSIDFAEPWAGQGVNQLVITLDVSDLSTLPANGEWKVYFTAPNGTEYFAAMQTDASGTPSFVYGQHTTSASGSNDVVDGQLPSSSGYSKNGTIRLVVPDADVGNLSSGQKLSSINGVTQQLAGAGGTGALATMDTTADGSYQLVGNASCQPNDPPVASMQASPTSGEAPLTVDFDASASYDPDGDGVAQYSFDFGDGTSPVTQTSPKISHTYQQAGSYQATLTVVDSRGKASTNTSAVEIDAQSAPAGAYEMRGSGRVTKVDGNPVRFDMDVTSVNTGSLRFIDKETGIDFTANSISGFSRTGGCVSYSGTGTLTSGSPVDFKVNACDNGHPGVNVDTFSIQLSGASSEAVSGTLSAGDLVLFQRQSEPAGADNF